MLHDRFVVSVDNAGSVGELPGDDIYATNETAAYYTARVTLLEQWCAGSMPTHILLANFTGDAAWTGYVNGIKQLYEELDLVCPPVTGSTETNFQMKQSAFSITMIGEKKWELPTQLERMHYYVIGEPLVGQQLVDNAEKAVSMQQLYNALQQGVVAAVWPTGSKGIGHELERFIGNATANVNLQASAGPSTAVIVATEKPEQLRALFSAPITKVILQEGE